jgi:hypothetical protein
MDCLGFQDRETLVKARVDAPLLRRQMLATSMRR